jgi:hypothetical protein
MMLQIWKGSFYTPLVGISSATLENSMDASLKTKDRCTLTRSSHFCLYSQKKRSHHGKEMAACPCLLEHYSQYLRCGMNLGDHQWMNR